MISLLFEPYLIRIWQWLLVRANIIILIKKTIMIQGSLKRNLFAEEIRFNQRERIKRQIRLQYQQKIPDHYPLDQRFDPAHFSTLRSECRNSLYSQENIKKAIGYLLDGDSAGRIAEATALKFFIQILDRLSGSGANRPHWQQQLIAEMVQNLKNVVEIEVKSDKNELGSEQFDELYILQGCFAEVIELASNYSNFVSLWKPLSQITNKKFSSMAMDNFYDFCQRNLANLPNDDLTTILISLNNFLRKSSPSTIPELLVIIDHILSVYHLGQDDMIILVETLNECLCGQSSKVESIVSTMLEQTKIIKQVVKLLDQSFIEVGRVVISKIAMFVAKIFSVSERLCNKVYQQHQDVIKLLASWLPINANSMNSVQIQTALKSNKFPIVLTHCDDRCTRHIVYALSNIVATDEGYINYFFKHHIYETLLLLYKAVPVPCRLEISYCLYNMVYRADDSAIAGIMLQRNLFDVLEEMLKQSDEDIFMNSLKICQQILISLPQEKDTYSLLPPRGCFAQMLLSIGMKSICEGHLCCKNEQIAKKAEVILSMLEEEP